MNPLIEQNLRQSLKNLHSHADWIQFKYIKEDTHHRLINNEKPKANDVKEDEGLMVEVLVDGQFAYSATQDTSVDGIQRATQKAIAQAKSSAPFGVFQFNEQKHRRASQGQYRSPSKTRWDKNSLQSVSDVLMKASQKLQSHSNIVAASAYAQIIDTTQFILSNQGTEIFQSFFMVNTNFSATANKDSETQVRSDHGGLARCQQIGLEVFELASILERCENIREQAIELLSADDCPQGQFDLILAPDQMLLQIHESIGHPLEMDRILGDERNYAGWSFVQPSDFGKLKYGSNLMNVTFDPHQKGELASYDFDDSGLPATKEYLIEKGILKRGLGSQESQARLNIPGVANFRSSSWNRAPIDRMANINLEPGTHTLEQLISNVEHGIYMESNKSWSIDDYRNKFQFGCEYAKLIENGKLTKTLKNPNYRGTTIDFWNHLKMLSAQTETYGSPYCGKGEPNQVIRVGHSSPYCLFDKIEVFGGHS